MFFFIGGIQSRTISLGNSSQACSVCGYSPVETKRIDHYLSVFFVPLFPVKKGTPFLFCPRCHGNFLESEKTPAVDPVHGRQVCRFCHKSFSTDFSFCPYCGKPVQ